jgi:hypothetical protein
MTNGTRKGWEVSVTSRLLFTPGERRGIHCTGGWGGPKGLSGQVQKISAPPGFNPWTVQPVASHYADWATWLCTGHRGSRDIALLFHDHGTRRGWGVSVTPQTNFTPGKTWYPLYRRLGGPQGQSGQVRKISPPPGFDPRTVQPVASHYTDWATWPTN